MCLAANLVTLGHDFGRVAHDHVKAGHFFLENRIRAIVALRHANALDAATDRRVHPFIHDLVRDQRDGLQSGRAESIDRGPGNRCGQTGEHGGDARDIVPLRTMRLAAAENHVFDLCWIELRRFAQNIFDAMRGQLIRTRDVERPAKRFSQRGTRTGNYHCFSHASPKCSSLQETAANCAKERESRLGPFYQCSSVTLRLCTENPLPQ